MDVLDQDDPDMAHADQIIDLVKHILKHLDQCQKSNDMTPS